VKSVTCLALLLFSTLAEAALVPADRIYWLNVHGPITNSLTDASHRSVVPVYTSRYVDRWDIAIDSGDNRMYWLDNLEVGDEYQFSIRRAYMDGSGLEVIHQATRDNLPVALAIDALHDKLYWATYETEDIMRSNLDGTNVERIFDGIIYRDNPYRIAVDPVHEKLYWSDISHRAIYQSSLDGTMRVALLQLAPNDPGPLAIDLVNEQLYWANLSGGWTYPSDGKIYRSNLDGSAMQIVISDVSYYYDVDIDPVAKKIYWIDANAEDDVTTHVANLDGTMVETLLSGEFFMRNLALHFPIVPEPSSSLLLGIGACVAAFGIRRRSNRRATRTPTAV
jgi:PEP-CTERM motif